MVTQPTRRRFLYTAATSGVLLGLGAPFPTWRRPRGAPKAMTSRRF
ncbi:MAG: twin-arginine translocation signal domain-containing protein [Planctomycetes bacterium]|nr:twin-arginine translocation signal domain-containing protein [Planctomycetota bacterium]